MPKLRETMVNFGTGVDFKTRVVFLAGLQLKSRHTKRSLDSWQFLLWRIFDIETASPDAGGLGGERRDQRREKLIAHRNPFRTGDILLVIWAGSALAQP